MNNNKPTTAAPDWSNPEVIVVRYGTRQTTKSECYYNFRAYREPDAEITMDYFFWIFRTDEQVIVIDTGFSPEAAIARKRQPVVKPADALARLGIDPAEVKLLVLTHAHYDHAGNLGLYPNAEIVMSRREFEFWGTEMGKRPQYAITSTRWTSNGFRHWPTPGVSPLSTGRATRWSPASNCTSLAVTRRGNWRWW
jgi:glyoxylase-like metal-dependent hydrolase (beta-lactamase superfamily II)